MQVAGTRSTINHKINVECRTKVTTLVAMVHQTIVYHANSSTIGITENRRRFLTMQHFLLLYLCVAAILLTSMSTPTYAFSLRSQPPVAFYSSCISSSSSSDSSSISSIIFKSINTKSIGLNSFPKPKSLPRPNCFHLKLTTSSNDNESTSDAGDSNSKAAETIRGLYDIMQRNFFVYFTILSDGRQSRITKVKVNEGDDIDSIIDEIKNNNSPDFDDVPAYRIELFESVERTEPLNALEMWKPNVSWGTKQQPLMVKVNPLITRVAAVSPWENSASKYVFCLYKSRCTHVPLVGHIILYILFSHKHSI